MVEVTKEFIPSSNETSDRPFLGYLAHRSGWTRENLANNLESAIKASNNVAGIEIDVRMTSDAVPVVVHENVSRMTYSDFQKKHPDNTTLEEWITAFTKRPELIDELLYLDMKTDGIDAGDILNKLAPLGKRAIVGTNDPYLMLNLMAIRYDRRPEIQTQLFYQIQEPVLPQKAIQKALNLYTYAKRDRKLKIGNYSSVLLEQLRPDGVVFAWTENILRNILTNISGHGEIVVNKDKKRINNATSKVRGYPKLPLLDLVRENTLAKFCALARENGLQIISGVTASPSLEKKMIKEWQPTYIVDDIVWDNPEIEGMVDQIKEGLRTKDLQNPTDSRAALSAMIPKAAVSSNQLRKLKNIFGI